MSEPKALTQPFPKPGPAVAHAYRELHLAIEGNEDQKKSLGNPSTLPRPWIPSTCTQPQLRIELWNWLEAAVTWINHELVFAPDDALPCCWPHHAHLVHEIAVLVDLRYRAETALDSHPLEEWHRYALPAFIERMRHRVRQHCDHHHANPVPHRGRFSRHISNEHAQQRCHAYAADVRSLSEQPAGGDAESKTPTLRVVDDHSGELFD